MPLKLTLKAGEKIYTGKSHIYIDSGSIEKLYIEGPMPVMRERDYLPEELANTEARMIYLVLQRCYLEDRFDLYKDEYFRRSGELIAAKPDAMPFIASINRYLAGEDMYRAVKEARKLVQFDEGELLSETESAQFTGF